MTERSWREALWTGLEKGGFLYVLALRSSATLLGWSDGKMGALVSGGPLNPWLGGTILGVGIVAFAAAAPEREWPPGPFAFAYRWGALALGVGRAVLREPELHQGFDLALLDSVVQGFCLALGFRCLLKASSFH